MDKVTLPGKVAPDEFISIIDDMYDEVIIYDGNYTIVYVNQACARHYSCSPDHMIGKSFFDFVNNDWWGPSILPVVYKNKKAYAIKQVTYIGSELLTIAVPIFDDNHEIQYVVMNVRDSIEDVDLYNPQYISEPKNIPQEGNLVAESEEMGRVMELARKVANIEATCLLTGESGTGKTMLAQYIHSISSRKEGPLICLNCANIPTELVESELFGYSKGAFTGANVSGKKGLIESADKGTVLLDEISELSMSAQAKLLTFLQEKEFYPIGANKPVKVDVRVIAATNKNLKNMVETGRFREDLYYRINVMDIYVPPLRKRKQDIPSLVNQFMTYFTAKYGVKRQLSQGAMQILSSYEWKGNVRELRHLVERLVVTVDSLVIDVAQLPNDVFGIVDCGVEITEVAGSSLEEKMGRFEAYIINEAYREFKSSRKLAEHLSISQTKANKLIQKYVKEESIIYAGK